MRLEREVVARTPFTFVVRTEPLVESVLALIMELVALSPLIVVVRVFPALP